MFGRVGAVGRAGPRDLCFEIPFKLRLLSAQEVSDCFGFMYEGHASMRNDFAVWAVKRAPRVGTHASDVRWAEAHPDRSASTFEILLQPP